MTAAHGDVEVEDLVNAAVVAAFRRIKRKIETGGPLSESGSGFRGYCRVVLMNEVRRCLGARARKHARQLNPGETLVLRLGDGTDLFPIPWADVDGITIDVVAYPHKWNEALVSAQQDHSHSGVLEIGIGSAVRRRSITDPSDVQGAVPLKPRELNRMLLAERIEIDEPDSDQIRVSNHSAVAGLHVRLNLVGYRWRGGASELPVPRKILSTIEGIGLSESNLPYDEARSRGAGGVPWSSNRARRSRVPRLVAQREFVPCDKPASDADRESRMVQSWLNLQEVPTNDGHTDRGSREVWLSGPRVRALASSAWQRFWVDRESSEQHAVCALAEWASPGLHPPHRPGNRGGHPLRSIVEAVVAAEDRAWCDANETEITSNSRSQARRRLRQRIEIDLAMAGLAAHGTPVGADEETLQGLVRDLVQMNPDSAPDSTGTNLGLSREQARELLDEVIRRLQVGEPLQNVLNAVRPRLNAWVTGK